MSKSKFWIPLTYAPKISGVLAGTIRQTIRMKRLYKTGDKIAFHGWAGVPYRSPWSFRTPYLLLREVVPILVFPEGISSMVSPGWSPRQMFWPYHRLDNLAAQDGIVPATGAELGRVLTGYHKIPEAGVEAQILRW